MALIKSSNTMVKYRKNKSKISDETINNAGIMLFIIEETRDVDPEITEDNYFKGGCYISFGNRKAKKLSYVSIR